MKPEQTSGIILRTRPLTETSLIVHWLTPQFGRIATVAKGARRGKSPFRGKLDLFYEADFGFIRSRRSDLHTLTEVVLRETHEAIRQDLERLQQAAYAVALLEQTTETETPMPDEFRLLTEFVRFVAGADPDPAHAQGFELKLLALLGQAPDLASTSLSQGARRIAQQCLELPWDAISRLRPTAGQTRELKQFLHGFLIDHLGNIPKSRP